MYRAVSPTFSLPVLQYAVPHFYLFFWVESLSVCSYPYVERLSKSSPRHFIGSVLGHPDLAFADATTALERWILFIINTDTE